MKRFFLSFLPMALLLMVSFSCKKETAKPDTSSKVAPEQAGPQTVLYAVRVESLRMRKDPSQESEVVTHVSEGEFLKGKGRITETKDTAELRGVLYDEPYYEVATTRPEQETGWVFGGGIRKIYDGPEVAAPDLGKLTQLSDFLKNLKTTDLASGGKAWNFVKTLIQPADPAMADATCVLLSDFLLRMEVDGSFYSLTEQVKWEDRDYQRVYEHTFPMKSNPITHRLMDNGFSLATGEGMIFPVTDRNAIWEYFSDKVSPGMKEYLRLDGEDYRNPSSDDGGLVIPLAVVADRAIAWERLGKQYPHFILNEEVITRQKWYIFTFISGMNNTPVVNGETEQVQDDFTRAWKSALTKYPESELAVHVRQVVKLVEEAKGKYPEAAGAYARKLLE